MPQCPRCRETMTRREDAFLCLLCGLILTDPALRSSVLPDRAERDLPDRADREGFDDLDDLLDEDLDEGLL
jgi:hypothetical protein